MEISEKELQDLDLLINDYIKGIPKVKYRLTKKVCNLSKKYGADQTKQAMKLLLMLAALENPGERVQTLLSKYTPSAPYIEKSDSGRSEYTMGWYSDTEQVHSVMLPIQITKDEGILVDFYGLSTAKNKYLKLFQNAELIPYSYSDGIDVIANISIVSIWKNGKMYRYKVANPIWTAALYITFFPLASVEDFYLISHPIPIIRLGNLDFHQEPFWNVRTNIKEFGFWKAYDWWEGCQTWYKQQHPEWFDENNWHWGIEARFDVGTIYGDSLW